MGCGCKLETARGKLQAVKKKDWSAYIQRKELPGECAEPLTKWRDLCGIYDMYICIRG